MFPCSCTLFWRMAGWLPKAEPLRCSQVMVDADLGQVGGCSVGCRVPGFLSRHPPHEELLGTKKASECCSVSLPPLSLPYPCPFAWPLPAQEYRFDVNFIGAANVHYFTVRRTGWDEGGPGGTNSCSYECEGLHRELAGSAARGRLAGIFAPSSSRRLPARCSCAALQGRSFGAWMRESGLRAGEQIRVKRDAGHVLIQRVPADMKVGAAERGARTRRAGLLMRLPLEALCRSAPN